MTHPTSDDDRLVAFLAVFAPARAAALVALLVPPGGDALVETAMRAAAAPRRERLARLADALSGAPPEPDPAALVAALARAERPSVAAALGALAPGTGPRAGTLRPALLRVLRERVGVRSAP